MCMLDFTCSPENFRDTVCDWIWLFFMFAWTFVCLYVRKRAPDRGEKEGSSPFLCSPYSASKPITGVRKHISCGRGSMGLRGGWRVEGHKDKEMILIKKSRVDGPNALTLLQLCDTWHTHPRDKTIMANSWTHQLRTDHYYGLIHQHN